MVLFQLGHDFSAMDSMEKIRRWGSWCLRPPLGGDDHPEKIAEAYGIKVEVLEHKGRRILLPPLDAQIRRSIEIVMISYGN